MYRKCRRDAECDIEFENGLEMIQKLGGQLRGYSTGLPKLDEMMGGSGILSHEIVEICGPSNSGKTQLCMSAVVSCVLSSNQLVVVYDYNGSWQPERLLSLMNRRISRNSRNSENRQGNSEASDDMMQRSRHRSRVKNALKRILIKRIDSQQNNHLQALLKNLRFLKCQKLHVKQIGMIVIDSMTLLAYSGSDEMSIGKSSDYLLLNGCIGRQLREMSADDNIAVLMVNRGLSPTSAANATAQWWSTITDYQLCLSMQRSFNPIQIWSGGLVSNHGFQVNVSKSNRQAISNTTTSAVKFKIKKEGLVFIDDDGDDRNQEEAKPDDQEEEEGPSKTNDYVDMKASSLVVGMMTIDGNDDVEYDAATIRTVPSENSSRLRNINENTAEGGSQFVQKMTVCSTPKRKNSVLINHEDGGETLSKQERRDVNRQSSPGHRMINNLGSSPLAINSPPKQPIMQSTPMKSTPSFLLTVDNDQEDKGGEDMGLSTPKKSIIVNNFSVQGQQSENWIAITEQEEEGVSHHAEDEKKESNAVCSSSEEVPKPPTTDGRSPRKLSSAAAAEGGGEGPNTSRPLFDEEDEAGEEEKVSPVKPAAAHQSVNRFSASSEELLKTPPPPLRLEASKSDTSLSYPISPAF